MVSFCWNEKVKKTDFSNPGELEITYVTNFGRIPNLRALLGSRNFPDSFEPYLRQLRSLYEPIDFVPKSKTYQRNS